MIILFYIVLDNQKASKSSLQATTFKAEENSRTFQGLPKKFKDFQECTNPVKVVPQIDVSLFQV